MHATMLSHSSANVVMCEPVGFCREIRHIATAFSSDLLFISNRWPTRSDATVLDSGLEVIDSGFAESRRLPQGIPSQLLLAMRRSGPPP